MDERMPYEPGDRVVTERGHATVSAVDAGGRKVHLVYDGPEMWSGWRTVRTVVVLSKEAW